MQQIYSAITALKFNKASLENLHLDLKDLSFSETEYLFANNNRSNGLQFEKKISLDRITFTYPNESAPSLIDINIDFPAKSIIGIVGHSGSGKTTMVDLILGLIQAQDGSLKIDGVSLDKSNVSYWQNMIAYVPQNINLVNGSILSNITLGELESDIDFSYVVHAAKISGIHDFITLDLPQGYKTNVGEKGIRLSGGQRQRIGLARALYRRPKLLVLDEATSALDTYTETKIIQQLNVLRDEMTMILIAHRISTIIDCDQIFLFEKGRIVAKGTYNELLSCNKKFQILSGS
jgi:ABC-type bacteriocin/lantibiotic exporter with double-glycine peptidase domain